MKYEKSWDKLTIRKFENFIHKTDVLNVYVDNELEDFL